MKKDLVPKPNQLIEIKGIISGVQTKMYNVILARVHQELKNGNKEIFYINLEDIKKASGVTDKNDTRLRKYLKSLVTTAIEYVDEKGEWGGFGLLSSFKKEGDLLRISLDPTIREALIKNNYYTTIDLLNIRLLQGKYSIILYELSLKYHKIEIPELTLEYLREITNTETRYKDYYDLNKRVIAPAIEEINEKTDIELSYDIRKTGRKVTHIQFHVKKKEVIEKLETKLVKKSLKEIPQEKSFTTITAKGEDKLENAILKAKKNIYISKAWNKRADNKVKAVLDIHGEDYVVDMLKRAYNGCQREIEKTLVQYFNGIIKNMKLDAGEVQEKEQKKAKTKEKLITRPIEVREEPKEVQSVNYYAIFERLNKDVQDDILKQAREMYLEETKTPSFDTIHEKIFNVAKKVYINRILG